MLALFAKIQSDDIASTKDQQFSADSKYSEDHSPLLRFPHLRWSRVYSSIRGSPVATVINQRHDIENEYGISYLYNTGWAKKLDHI